MTSTEVLWEHDTVVWRQRLERSGDGIRLVRAYKGAGPWPQTVPDAVRDATGPAAGMVAPSECSAGSYCFGLAGQEQLAVQLWPRTAPIFLSGGGLVGMRRLGVLLARLHRTVPTTQVGPGATSPHLRRLRGYLQAPAPGAAAKAVGSLEPQTVIGLGDLLDALTAAPHQVVCHGGFSLGSVFADPAHRRLECVVGPELCVGPPELDLGWMIGEFTEYELSTVRAGSPTDLFSQAAASLRSAYDDEVRVPVDHALLDGIVAARIALHRFDYVATTGHPEQTTMSSFIDWLVERWRRETPEEEAR